MDQQARTIATGFAHSAAIGKQGSLFVWGDNSNQQLLEHGKVGSKQIAVNVPTAIPLKYQNRSVLKTVKQSLAKLGQPDKGEQQPTHNSYQAIEVDAGPYFTMAVAKHQEKTMLEEEEYRDILNELKKILFRDGTLLKFFSQKTSSIKFRGTIARSGTIGSAPAQDEDEDDQLEALLNIDPYSQEITRKQFFEKLMDAKICKTTGRASELAKVISDYGGYKSEGHNLDATLLNIGDLEDFVLGFLQHNTKVFLFGQFHKALGCFESKIQDNSDNDQNDNFMKMQLGGRGGKIGPQSGSELRVVTQPTAILFPKFTKPLMSVACGSAHALILTIDQEMYSWGAGNYGALGFGFRDDQPSPRRLDINDHKGQKYKIQKICCGKFHSMCLTSRQNILSWGEGSLGRLGHGENNEEDQLLPKEIYTLSKRKPIIISAGESHSAAITEKWTLFTWGNGGFGRLGHGADTKEYSPKIVEGLLHEEVVQVSCGSFHTLAVTSSGSVFCFGQNKYGKLGIHPQNSKDGDVHKEPVRISMYKLSHGYNEPTKEKAEIIQASAGFNHSLVLSKAGRAYSFGYNGKGVLGRITYHFRVPVQVGQGLQFVQAFLTGGNSFLKAIHDQAMEFKAQQTVQRKNVEEGEFYIRQIICGAVNTVSLTSTGEVYVLGDNTFGQHACEKLEPQFQQFMMGMQDPDEEQPIPYGASIVKFPFQTADKIEYVSCGGEHLFAQSAIDEIYGWGRNDEGQIGVGFLTEKIIEPMFVKDLSYKGIKQISCSDNYSAALTIYGEVFVAGSLEGGKLGLGKGQKRGYQLNFRNIPTLPEIDFIACGVQHMLAISRYNPDPEPGNKVQKQNGKTYAWGKNQRGQLGIGNKENQYSPCPIENTKERFKKVACGTNFSIGLSHTNRVYFWGNFKYYCSYKVSKDIEEPIIMNQLEEDEVFDITCDYKYVAALIDKGEIRQWGKFLLQKQQQGDKKETAKSKKKKDDKDDDGKQSETKIEAIAKFPVGSKFNILFDYVHTGPNHTVAVSTGNKVYVWGYNNVNNRLGVSTNQESMRALVEPVQLSQLQGMLDKQKENNMAIQATQGNKNGGGDESAMDGGKQLGAMDGDSEKGDEEQKGGAIAMGVEIEDQQQPGGEGEPQDENGGGMEGRDGEQDVTVGGPAEPSKQARTFMTPQNVSLYEQISRREAQASKKQQAATGKISSSDFTQLIINDISKFNKNRGRAKDQKKAAKELNIFDENVDLFVLEFLRQEMHKKSFAGTVSLIPNQKTSSSLVNSNIVLQKILKKEESCFEDEKAIIKLDVEIVESVKKVLTQVIKFGRVQLQNGDMIMKMKTSFLSRIPESPFDIDRTQTAFLKTVGMEKELVESKKFIQQIMYYLYVHPCYFIKILKSDLLTFEDRKQIIKQFFTSPKKTATVRNNYQLLSIFKTMVKHELNGTIEEVDLYSKNSKTMSAYIFRRIFKSQLTNVDTICCIITHIINMLVSTSQQSGGNSADDSFDVKNETGGGGGGGKGGKGGGGSSQTKKAQDLADFVETMINDIMTNFILKDQNVYFNFRKKVQAQLDFVKLQFKIAQDAKIEALGNQQAPMNNDVAKNSMLTTLAGIDSDQVKEKFPAIRFSEEVHQMLSILHHHLKHMEGGPNKDDLISSNILGLIFAPQVRKIWEMFDLFLYPYLSKIRLMSIVEDQLKKVHNINITNIIETFLAFMTGEQAFPDSESENWNKELNQKLAQHQQTTKQPLLNKILKYGQEISGVLPYKNFENQIIHSLEQDDTRLCISKNLLGTILMTYFNNKKALSIQTPMKNDPLIKELEKFDVSAVSGLTSLPPEDKINFRLKSRLFVPAKGQKVSSEEGQMNQYVRCLSCQAMLTQEVAVQNYDENIVQTHYEPQDKQSLMTLFCEILKGVQPIAAELYGSRDKKGGGQSGNINSFIEKAATTARRNADYRISEMIQEFQKKIKIEVENLRNKQNLESRMPQNDGYGMQQQEPQSDLDEESQLQEQVIWNLVQEAELKINERVTQKFNLIIIQRHIDQYLQNHIQSRIDHFKAYQIKQNELIQQNYQYGLANRDMIHLSDNTALAKMAQVKNFVASQKMSQSLSKGLRMEQKQKIRGYLRLEAATLIKNGTIKKISLNELNPLMPKSQVVLIESEDGQSVEFKLVFRDTKFNICGPDTVLQEHTILQFEITQKQLKQIRSKIVDLKQVVEAPKKGGKPKGEEEEEDLLTFPENDAIGFDYEKFLALLTQMERQKSAYILQASEEAGRKPQRKK